MHKAIREALANCFDNADFFVKRGIVIKKDPDKLVIENPGYIRTGKDQMLKGGISDPRNKALIKMFNLIGIGERAGSGVPDIFAIWEGYGWETPVIEEQFNPDRTILTLPFTKRAIKASDKNKRQKQAIKTNDNEKTLNNKKKILDYMTGKGEVSTKELAELLGLSTARTRVIVRELCDDNKILSLGEKRNRRYKIKG